MRRNTFLSVVAALTMVLFMASQSLAITITLTKSYRNSAGEHVRIGTIAFDTSYPTNGESLTATDVNLSVMRNVQVQTTSGYLFEYDLTNSKVKAYYASGSPAVANAAVTLDTGASGAEAAHTHPAPTAAFYGPGDLGGVTVGTPKLTHDLDPPTNFNAQFLYGLESYGAGERNILYLESVTNGNADVLGSTDDVSGIPGAATPRFYVHDNNTPTGVKIYVDEASNDSLIFISPTATDAYIIMPFEAIADAIPGFAYAVKVAHKASMSGATELYFDDNGAADAQLYYNDTGTSDGVIYASDIEVIAPGYMAIDTSGVSGAGASHTHAYGTLGDAAHLHTVTAEAADEVGSGDNLVALTAVSFIAIGY